MIARIRNGEAAAESANLAKHGAGLARSDPSGVRVSDLGTACKKDCVS